MKQTKPSSRTPSSKTPQAMNTVVSQICTKIKRRRTRSHKTKVVSTSHNRSTMREEPKMRMPQIEVPQMEEPRMEEPRIEEPRMGEHQMGNPLVMRSTRSPAAAAHHPLLARTTHRGCTSTLEMREGPTRMTKSQTWIAVQTLTIESRRLLRDCHSRPPSIVTPRMRALSVRI